MQELFIKLNNHKEYLENLGYDVIYVGLYGSQNYNLDDKDSDVDTKAVVVPSLEMLLKKEDLSIVYDVEGGQIDVKDALSFYNVIKKGNPAYLESLYSKYSIGDKVFKQLMMSHKPHPQAMIGMMRQKREAIMNRLPNSYPLMDKIGYDPKQYHHIVRLYDGLKAIKMMGDETSFIVEYHGDKRLAMIEQKRNPKYTQKEVLEHAAVLIEEVEEDFKEYRYKSENNDEEVFAYLKQLVIKSLINTSDLDYSVDQHRTFGQNIPKRDKILFPQLIPLEKYDISYTIYSYLEVLDWGKPYEEKGSEHEDL